jgi:hypothetical protein
MLPSTSLACRLEQQTRQMHGPICGSRLCCRRLPPTTSQLRALLARECHQTWDSAVARWSAWSSSCRPTQLCTSWLASTAPALLIRTPKRLPVRGTFVVLANGTALVAAGGGGGSSFNVGAAPPNDMTCDASKTSGNGQRSQSNMAGGTGGGGGTGVGAGGGFTGNGGDATNHAYAALNGGDAVGGSFPGGGRFGGGGGWSGGAGYDASFGQASWGGGGGSFCTAGLANCGTGFNARPSSSYTGTDAGYVTVMQLPPV